MIRVFYSSIDGSRMKLEAQDLARAREWAWHWIGPHPEIGRSYAVADDGVGKITVEGCTLAELFPSR